MAQLDGANVRHLVSAPGGRWLVAEVATRITGSGTTSNASQMYVLDLQPNPPRVTLLNARIGGAPADETWIVSIAADHSAIIVAARVPDHVAFYLFALDDQNLQYLTRFDFLRLRQRGRRDSDPRWVGMFLSPTDYARQYDLQGTMHPYFIAELSMPQSMCQWGWYQEDRRIAAREAECPS